MTRRSLGFIDQVRRALKTSGASRYALSQETGIPEASLSRFLHGKGLSMESLDRLADALRLEVTVRGDG